MSEPRTPIAFIFISICPGPVVSDIAQRFPHRRPGHAPFGSGKPAVALAHVDVAEAMFSTAWGP